MLSLQSIAQPEVYTKSANNKLIRLLNFTRIHTYYLLFSPELMCRFVASKNITTCFYYPSSMNFIQVEHEFDRVTNVTLGLSSEKQRRFIMICIVMAILVITLCLFALYILCSNRLVYNHINRIDYTIDPQIVKQTELKLPTEPA